MVCRRMLCGTGVFSGDAGTRWQIAAYHGARQAVSSTWSGLPWQNLADRNGLFLSEWQQGHHVQPNGGCDVQDWKKLAGSNQRGTLAFLHYITSPVVFLVIVVMFATTFVPFNSYTVSMLVKGHLSIWKGKLCPSNFNVDILWLPVLTVQKVIEIWPLSKIWSLAGQILTQTAPRSTALDSKKWHKSEQQHLVNVNNRQMLTKHCHASLSCTGLLLVTVFKRLTLR